MARFTPKRWRQFFAAVLVLSSVLLIPDVRYGLKHWLKETFGETTGWERVVTTQNNDSFRLTFTSPIFKVDTLFPSMTGPAETHFFHAIDDRAPDLVWLTGVGAEVIEADSRTILGEDFLCHNNLDYALGDYCKYWDLENRKDVLVPRLATLTQGQSHIQFPPGFGIPLRSDHTLSTATQVLNLNQPSANLSIQHQISLEYTTAKLMKPLFQQSVSVQVRVDTATANPDPLVDCSPALSSIGFLSSRENGELYTGHWIIPPGRDTFAYEITPHLALPFNTTVHYIGTHVHPYCDKLELFDLSTEDIVFSAAVVPDPDKTQMKDIGIYSSEEGIQLFTDHRYELRCFTNNTSGLDQDMMAVMLLYLYDHELAEKLKG